MANYYIVPADVVEQYQGAVNETGGLYFVQDNQNRYVMNIGVEANWPQIDWASFEIVDLTLEDFPQPEI